MKDSDQREMKRSEAEKDSDQREWKSWVAHSLGLRGLGRARLRLVLPGLALPGLARPGLRMAWSVHGLGLRGLGSGCLGARGLGRAQPGLALPRRAGSGLRVAWVYHPFRSWSLFLFLVFFFLCFLLWCSGLSVSGFFFLCFLLWCSGVPLICVLFVRVRNRVSKTRFSCSHVEKYATSKLRAKLQFNLVWRTI